MEPAAAERQGFTRVGGSGDAMSRSPSEGNRLGAATTSAFDVSRRTQSGAIGIAGCILAAGLVLLRLLARRPARRVGLAVIIPSAGRPEVLHDTVLSLHRQSLQPAQIIVSVPDEDSVLPATREWCDIVYGPKGSCHQRNRGVAAVRSDIEFVSFIDDDIELRDDYFERLMRAFSAHPSLVLACGDELADGGVAYSDRVALGIGRREARQMLADDRLYRRSPTTFMTEYVRDRWDVLSRVADIACGVRGDWLPRWLIPANNMSIRRSVLHSVKFDERMPLYAWMEDYDFTLTCAKFGRVARLMDCRLVHLGATGGRVSPKRLGFVQVMNPIYIWSKRHRAYSVGSMLIFVARILAGNIVGFPRHPSERWQRLQGNAQALAMALRGDLRPERMADISD